VVAGKIVSASPSAVVVESVAGVRSTVRLEGFKPLQVIRPGSRNMLSSGRSVAVLTSADSDEAEAVLIFAAP
jgi:hypothetical protein